MQLCHGRSAYFLIFTFSQDAPEFDPSSAQHDVNAVGDFDLLDNFSDEGSDPEHEVEVEDAFDVTNPFKESIKDSEGNLLEPGTRAYYKQMGERSKCNKRTKAAQDREYKTFQTWVEAAKGPDVWKAFAASTLAVEDAGTIMAGFIAARINKTVFKKVRLLCICLVSRKYTHLFLF